MARSCRQIFIGSQVWVDSMRGIIESKPRSADHLIIQRYVTRPRPAKVVEVLANVFENTPYRSTPATARSSE